MKRIHTLAECPVYVSTGAFIGRANGRDPRHFLSVADKLPCDGFECMLYDVWYERLDEVLDTFLSRGAVYPVLHVEKRIGELVGDGEGGYYQRAMERFSLNCHAAKRLGASTLVFHLWNGTPSDAHFDRHLRMCGDFLAMAKESGLTLAVENVVCAYGSPLDHLEALAYEYPDVRFTYDTKMASFHREVNDVFSPRYRFLFEKGYIAHLHINDHGGAYRDFEGLRTLHIGEGCIDFDTFFDELVKVGYTGAMTLECASVREDGSLRAEDMCRSLGRVREYLQKETDK